MDDGRMRVIEHGRDARGYRPLSVPPGDRPRIAVFGALGIAKGISLLRSLLELDRDNPAFEFHFFGPLHGTFAPEEVGGIAHGSYEREELPARLAAVKPSYALITSIWPETYCHTLTEAWMADLPVFASDIGTLRERIGQHGGGWLLDHTQPEAFYAGMRRVGGNLAEWHLRRAEIAATTPRTVDDMASDYRAIYRELVRA
jgi:glycosyltransferase involved in cell wall biosynthesis